MTTPFASLQSLAFTMPYTLGNTLGMCMVEVLQIKFYDIKGQKNCSVENFAPNCNQLVVFELKNLKPIKITLFLVITSTTLKKSHVSARLI